MRECFNLEEMLKEIDEIEKSKGSGEKTQVSQDDILKMLAMRSEESKKQEGPMEIKPKPESTNRGPLKKVKKTPNPET